MGHEPAPVNELNLPAGHSVHWRTIAVTLYLPTVKFEYLPIPVYVE